MNAMGCYHTWKIPVKKILPGPIDRQEKKSFLLTIKNSLRPSNNFCQRTFGTIMKRSRQQGFFNCFWTARKK
jgi:hypothetical protein